MAMHLEACWENVPMEKRREAGCSNPYISLYVCRGFSRGAPKQSVKDSGPLLAILSHFGHIRPDDLVVCLGH